MHLLTGMLIGEILLGGKIRGLGGKTNPFTLVHASAGRVRFRVPTPIQDSDVFVEMGRTLEAISGVTQARLDHRTGSVLVTFDDSEATRQEIIHTLVAYCDPKKTPHHNRSPSAWGSQEPMLGNKIRELTHVMDEELIKHSQGLTDIKSLVGFGFFLWGAKQLLRPTTATRFNGLSLCWWGYNLLKK